MKTLTLVRSSRLKAILTGGALALAACFAASAAQAAATGAPGTPTLTQDNWDGKASYSIIMNMWWGNNGTSLQLFENGALVKTVALTDNSPNAQTATVAFANKPNGSYVYTAKLTNSFGTTSGSALTYTVTQGGTGPTVPPVPTGLAATANSTSQITVTWSASSGATGYDLQVDGTVVSNVTSPYAHTGLAAGSSHTYAVRAKNSAGTSAFSASVTAFTQSTPTLPAVPTGLTATANSSSQITVTWNAVANATGYDLQVDGATVSSVTSPYVHSGLAASSTHTYAVRAKNSVGSSAFSTTVSAKTQTAPTVPAVPTGLTAVANGSSQITVTWNASSGATGYDLQVDGATVSDVTSPYAHTGLAASSTHTYAVRAKNAAGASAFSTSVSATTSAATSGGLTLGQVANPNGRYYAGYYPTWSDNWFTVTNWDGTKKSDNDIYTASNLAQVAGVYTHVQLAFAQPDFTWGGLGANSWSGTGLNFNATPADIKEVIRLLHILKKRVILAVGGATYNNWSTLAGEAGRTGPTKTALTHFLTDLGVDGLDVDYEVDGADAGNVTQYAHAIQAMREAVNDAGSGHFLTLAAWSTGADYTADLASDPGYPGTPSYWGGSAGRERKTFKVVVSSGSLAGRTIASLLDVVNVMAYDAQTFHFDPVTAFDEYRGIVSSSTVVSVGLEIPPEGWAGGLLILHNSEAGPSGTIVVADQYGRTPRGPYSVERSVGHVMANTTNANPHDGAMLWEILKTTSSTSANATSVSNMIAGLFGYTPKSP